MSAQDESRGPSAIPSKEPPTRHGGDGRKATQDDRTARTYKNPPNHGLPTHGIGRFLWEAPSETPISSLAELYEEWQEDRDQVDLGRWSE